MSNRISYSGRGRSIAVLALLVIAIASVFALSAQRAYAEDTVSPVGSVSGVIANSGVEQNIIESTIIDERNNR